MTRLLIPRSDLMNFLKNNKGQISAEMLIVMAALIAASVFVAGEIIATGKTFGGKYSSIAKSAASKIKLTG